MPAGTSTENRFKSLEESFKRGQLKDYLPENIYKKLGSCFKEDESIYIWGTRKGSISQLKNVQEGEYVLDFKNKEVPTVFEFCFWYKPNNNNLQNFIGWEGKFEYVYFLKNPQTPDKSSKEYYGKALGYNSGPRWLMGQRYIDDQQLDKALDRTDSKSVEDFMGITPSKGKRHKSKTNTSENTNPNNTRPTSKKKSPGKESTRQTTKASGGSTKRKKGQVVIQQNQKGISYDDLFADYLKGATDITVVDPYIRLPYQVRNFMEFAQVIADQKGKNEVLLHLVTDNHNDYLSNSEDAFTDIRDTLEPLGIFFTYEFDEEIHDRYIKTNNGWKIILGRGLDLFQKTRGKFDIAELNQKQRKCKACEITYLRVDDSN